MPPARAEIAIGCSAFKLFDSKDAAAAYHYTGRLPGKPQERVIDFQLRPLEPHSARFTLTATL